MYYFLTTTRQLIGSAFQIPKPKSLLAGRRVTWDIVYAHVKSEIASSRVGYALTVLQLKRLLSGGGLFALWFPSPSSPSLSRPSPRPTSSTVSPASSGAGLSIIHQTMRWNFLIGLRSLKDKPLKPPSSSRARDAPCQRWAQ